MKNETIADFPPYPYLLQVLEHCPKAGTTYMSLWRNRNGENKIHVDKSDIRNEYLMSLAKFRHDILLLVRESLINVDETPKSLYIELVDWDFEEDDLKIC